MADWYNPAHLALSALGAVHDQTALPWWVTIAATTIALRVALLPAAQLYANAVRGTLGKVDSAPVQRVVTSVAVNWFIVGFIASMKLSESI